MCKYWNKTTKGLKPYIPGEQSKEKKWIKLNTNENPYPPSPFVLAAIKNGVTKDLRLYPDPECEKLKMVVAEYYNVQSDEVFIGNGSDEVLAFAFQAFFDSDKAILFPEITYSFYPVYCNLYGLSYRTVALDNEFYVPIKKFLIKNGGIILPNPNAPTAIYTSLKNIKSIVEFNNDSVVIVDEAYIDFGGESAIELIHDYPNLLVIQTLSKSRSLAGLRVGLAIGNKNLIQGLNMVKNSFNSYTIDTLALIGAIESFKDTKHFDETRKKIIFTREKTCNILKKIGFIVTDSKANFLFISHSKLNADTIFKSLKEKGILVRYFNKHKIDNFLRVSIGTDDEMESFIEALKEILSENGL